MAVKPAWTGLLRVAGALPATREVPKHNCVSVCVLAKSIQWGRCGAFLLAAAPMG